MYWLLCFGWCYAAFQTFRQRDWAPRLSSLPHATHWVWFPHPCMHTQTHNHKNVCVNASIQKQLLFTCTLCRRVIERVNVHVYLKWPPKLHDNGGYTFLSGYIGHNTNMGCHTEVTISPDSQSIPELSSVLHVVTLRCWWVTVSEDLISLNVLLLCAARSPMYAQMFTIVVFPCWPATVIHEHTHYKTGFNLLRGWRGSPPPQAMKLPSRNICLTYKLR